MKKVTKNLWYLIREDKSLLVMATEDPSYLPYENGGTWIKMPFQYEMKGNNQHHKMLNYGRLLKKIV